MAQQGAQGAEESQGGVHQEWAATQVQVARMATEAVTQQATLRGQIEPMAQEMNELNNWLAASTQRAEDTVPDAIEQKTCPRTLCL